MILINQQGIALWGGEDFHQVAKFGHQGVQFIEFSPCEKYLVTFSPTADTKSEEPTSVIVWDSMTGAKKRAFHSENPPVIFLLNVSVYTNVL